MTLKPEHIVEALNKTPELKRRLIRNHLYRMHKLPDHFFVPLV